MHVVNGKHQERKRYNKMSGYDYGYDVMDIMETKDVIGIMAHSTSSVYALSVDVMLDSNFDGYDVDWDEDFIQGLTNTTPYDIIKKKKRGKKYE